MALRFPFVLLVPGILFIAAGCLLLRRAGKPDGEPAASRQFAQLRREAVIALCMGVALLAIGLSVGIAIQGLV